MNARSLPAIAGRIGLFPAIKLGCPFNTKLPSFGHLRLLRRRLPGVQRTKLANFYKLGLWRTADGAFIWRFHFDRVSTDLADIVIDSFIFAQII